MKSGRSQNAPAKAREESSRADESRQHLWRRIEWGLAIAIIAWLIVLHFLYLGQAGPLWRDEVGTIDFASMQSWGEIWQNLQYDNFPPLFVALARGWTLAGLNSDYSYRILGFLVGLGTLAAIWISARALGNKAPVLCLALYAISPLAIRVGDSMRPYGIGILFMLLSFGLVGKFVEAPTRRNLIAAVVATTLCVQSLYHNVFFIAAFLLAGSIVTLLRRQGKVFVSLVVIGIIAAVSLLPYLGIIRAGRDWFVISLAPIGWGMLWHSLNETLGVMGAWTPSVWIVVFAISLLAGLACGIRARAWRRIYVVSALLFGTTFYLLFLWKLQLRPQPWYFLIVLSAAALAIDAIWAGFEGFKIRAGRVVFSAVMVLGAIGASFSGVHLRQTNVDLVAATLRQSAKPNDMILVSPWYYGVSLQRYFETNRWTTVPPMPELRIHRYDMMKKHMESEHPVDDLVAQVQKTVQSGGTLWVVGTLKFLQPGEKPWHFQPYRPGCGVNDAAYFFGWTMQIAEVLQAHCTNLDQVPIKSDQPINPVEDLKVMAIKGWH